MKFSDLQIGDKFKPVGGKFTLIKRDTATALHGNVIVKMKDVDVIKL